jgi:hypothetical protein
MDLNKKLIDQLSDLSRNIKSLTSEVKENKNVVSAENANSQKEETSKIDKEKKESSEEQNKNFLKSLEGIFQKGIGEISKSNLESNGLIKGALGAVKGKGLESSLGAISPLKDKALESITSNVKVPKAVSGLLGKIPKFATGGIMDEDGLALVGEKGPEVVKLDKGSEVISNAKSTELLKKETAPEKTVDQTLATQKGPTAKQIERYRKYLLGQDPEWFKLYPDELEYEVDDWIHSMRYHNPITINSLLEGKKEEDTFTKEDVAKLSAPVNKVPEVKQEPEEISKKDQRKKEKEEKRKAKEEKRKAEDLLKSEIKPGEEKEKSSLLDKGKSFLKEKGVGEKGKNLLFSKGKDILTGKASLSDIAKNPASLLGDKSQLLGKGIGAATSLLSNKGLKEKAMDKLKGLKKEKGEEKASISTESPELKKIQPKEVKAEEVKETPKKEETPKEQAPVKKEIAKTEESTPTKSETANASKESKGGKSESIGATDLGDIKALLGKMVSLLEGPLSIESMDSPFRPDSRRF